MSVSLTEVIGIAKKVATTNIPFTVEQNYSCLYKINGSQSNMGLGNKILGTKIHNIGDITYSSGVFTLPKGRIYKVIGNLTDWNLNITGYGYYQFYDETSAGFVGVNAGGYTVTHTSQTNINGGNVIHVFNLLNDTSNRNISLRISSLSAGTSASINNGYVYIEEISQYKISNYSTT